MAARSCAIPTSPAQPLIQLIEAQAATLTPAQRELARHVTENYQSVAFATVAELARAARVSEATVVRFAVALGFAGYPAFQKEVRRMVRADLKGTDRFAMAEADRPAAGTPLDRAIAKEAENLRHLGTMQDASSLRAAAVLLRQARRVLVAGARSTAPLAFHVWFALDKLGLDAARTLTADSEALDRIGRMDARDVVLVIGFPRYLRALAALLDAAGSRGVRRIVVTDSPFSPLKGEVALHAPAESASFVAFHAAPLVLLNTLVEEVAATDRARALEALQGFEAVAEAGGYFLRP
jgi:DNA-binding MurR/RpiR family transcriptional regulator